MTMPHLMNCDHAEESWAWCLDCVKLQHDELEHERIEAGKYERCLHAAAQRLQDVYSLRDVKTVGLMEVPNVIDELIAERDALRAAMKLARAYAVDKQRKHPLGLRGFAAECGVSPTQLSQWTAEAVTGEPDIACSR
jgi:hypothetical protein